MKTQMKVTTREENVRPAVVKTIELKTVDEEKISIAPFAKLLAPTPPKFAKRKQQLEIMNAAVPNPKGEVPTKEANRLAQPQIERLWQLISATL